MMGVRGFSRILILLMIVVFVDCKDENLLVYNKTKIAGVKNLRAFSNDANSVGLVWSASPDSSKPEYVEIKIRALVGGAEVTSFTVPKTMNESPVIVQNLNEGTIHTFEVICSAQPSSQNYADSDPVTILWAPARRLNGDVPVQLYEIASPRSLDGLVFLEGGGGGSRVLSSQNPTVQPILDVVLDSTASGSIIMKSAHLNRFGGGVRHTRFSTFETLTNDLSTGLTAPPEAATYTRDSIFITSQQITTGKIFYAITNDSNYVRILFEKNSSSAPGSLLFGVPGDRYVSLRFSFQILKGVIYAKPNPGIARPAYRD